MQFTYESKGRTHTVTLEPQPDGSYRADIEGRAYHISVQQAADGGRLLIITDNNGNLSRHVVHAETDDTSRHVHVMGRTFTLAVPPDSASRRRSESHAGDLTAQMPGQVTAVLVAAGDTVEAGAPLVILEAMKMEMRVTAPGPGIVARVPVKAGDLVERGQVLVEISTGESESEA